MKRLLLVRHGQTAYNAEGRTISVTDPPLNDRGREQAISAARVIALEPDVRSVVSSPSRRCLETAYTIAEQRGPVAVATDNRLLELGMGEFEGRTVAEIRQEGLGDVFRSWRQGIPPMYPREAERFEDAAERLLDVFDDLTSHCAGTVVAVGHSHALRIMLTVAVLRGDPEAHRRLRLDHGSIASVEWEDDSPRLVGISSRDDEGFHV